MIRTSLIVAAAAACTGIAVLSGDHSTPFAPAAVAQDSSDAFNVDALHSSVQFELGYGGGVGVATGRFNTFEGNFNFDADSPSASKLSFSIETASIDTNSEDRDKHLRSPDFFNAGRFDTIRFTSQSVRLQGDTFKVTGELSLLGETKTVTVDVMKIGDGASRSGSPAQGIKSVFTITRSDFGMNYGVANGALGDDVTITVHAYGVK